MSEKRRDGKKRDDKRRDTKGRVLRNGESQEKDGKYTYKYTDAFGETRQELEVGQNGYDTARKASDAVSSGDGE